MYNLTEALNAYRQPREDGLLLSRPGGRFVADLIRAHASWPHRILPLVDFRQINLMRVFSKEKGFRRPKAWLKLVVTSRGNLALDWFPSPHAYFLDHGDWIHWSNTRALGGDWLPANRILFIRDFNKFRLGLGSCDRSPVGDSYFASALGALLTNIYDTLEQVVDIEVGGDLYSVSLPGGGLEDIYVAEAPADGSCDAAMEASMSKILEEM